MPVINLILNETDHQRFQHEYEAMQATWAASENSAEPPTLSEWLSARLTRQPSTAQAIGQANDESLSDVRLFNAIESVITSLPAHGVQLAHGAPPETLPASSALSLSKAIVEHCKLQPQYTKRLQELFTHYLKTPREIADTAHIGITNHAYGALTEAQRRFTTRTMASIERLGPDRAIGRIEGATAMLVNVEVMDPATAKRQTSAFKVQARASRKPGWVGKMFGAR